jgi:hypothetical protein
MGSVTACARVQRFTSQLDLALCHNLQNYATGQNCLAGCVDRCDGNCSPVRKRQIPLRPISGQSQHGIRFWCRRVTGGSVGVVYFVAQIFLLGAEFTSVYSHEYGSNASKIKKKSSVAVPCHSIGGTAVVDAK